MKIWLDTDEAYPVLVETGTGIEVEVPDALVKRWRAAEKKYWKAHGEIMKLYDAANEKE